MVDCKGVSGFLIKNAGIRCSLEMQTLACKLLKAPSGTCFITSDNPVVVLNQLCASAEPHRSFVGFSKSGFQLLMPISPELCLLFYDAKVYKVGSPRHRLVCISKDDVEVVNALQIQSAEVCVYFHEPKLESGIQSLIGRYAQLRAPVQDGLRTFPLNEVSDAKIARLLGFDQTQWPEFELEHPELLCFVHRSGEQRIPKDLPREIVSDFSGLEFQGTPNQLSEDHVDWEIISRVAEATAKPQSWEGALAALGRPGLPDTRRPFYVPTAESRIPAAQIIRQRRSAVAFDGLSSITRKQFCTMLDKTLPRDGYAPFDLRLTAPCVHLLLFVHRVTGLEPGLYVLVRAQPDLPALQRKCHRHFLWESVDEALPLYLLQADQGT
jgi:hypothetical protein